MSDFFDYPCDACGRPYCERIQVMNLVLDNIEDMYCLECLAAQEGQTPEAFYHWILDYVEARECFKTPWDNFDYKPCPRILDKSCFCPGGHTP
jgi:hypothetical protein